MTDKMPSTDRKLTLDMVAAPAMYRLALLVSPAGLDVLITSRVEDDARIVRHIDFQEGTDFVKAFEEAVYDNPLLTADFHSTDVLIDNNRFFVMATEDVSPQELTKRIDTLWPSERTGIVTEPVVSKIEDGRSVIVSAVEKNLASFLRRTFHNPSMMHRLGAPARFFALKNHLGNMGKLHVSLSAGRTDVFGFGRDGLLLVNSFVTETVDDALYYVLSVAQHLGFENDRDRILVSGDRDLRDEFVTAVRQFINLAMPEIFPTSLNASYNMHEPTPFELPMLALIKM